MALAGTRDALASGPLFPSLCVFFFWVCALLLLLLLSAACVGVGVFSFKGREELGDGGNRWARTGAASAALTVWMASLRNRLV